MPHKPAPWLARQVKQAKKDMDELPEWQKANRGFATPKPARRPVSAAEWQRRWNRLRRFISSENATSAKRCHESSRLFEFDWYGGKAKAHEEVLAEMSRLTRPTTRRPTRRKER